MFEPVSKPIEPVLKELLPTYHQMCDEIMKEFVTTINLVGDIKFRLMGVDFDSGRAKECNDDRETVTEPPTMRGDLRGIQSVLLTVNENLRSILGDIDGTS